MVRLTVDPTEMVQNMIFSKTEKRTLEIDFWSKNLASLLLSSFLFLLPEPPNQPQYKSAPKTMWALAITTVSFEW